MLYNKGSHLEQLRFPSILAKAPILHYGLRMDGNYHYIKKQYYVFFPIKKKKMLPK